MTYSEYQENFEKNALKEKEAYDSKPVSSLLRDILNQNFGQYYQICAIGDVMIYHLSYDINFLCHEKPA